ncbi:MAG: hypothetical protein U0807_15780 [Candidatus Binatia bacterium]
MVDPWYRGVIVRVSYGSESGVLRSDATGREYPFRHPLVDIQGPIPRVDGLREGMAVGFDVARSSLGVQVSVIKVFD